MTFDQVMQLGTFLLALGAMYIALRKATPEVREKNTGADLNLANATKVTSDAAIALNTKLVERVSYLETELAEACSEVEKIRDHIQAIEAENHLLRDWAKRLAGQVVMLGGVPVRMVVKDEENKQDRRE